MGRRTETEAHEREREKAVKAYMRAKSVGEELRDLPPATGAADALLEAGEMPGLPAPNAAIDLGLGAPGVRARERSLPC